MFNLRHVMPGVWTVAGTPQNRRYQFATDGTWSLSGTRTPDASGTWTEDAYGNLVLTVTYIGSQAGHVLTALGLGAVAAVTMGTAVPFVAGAFGALFSGGRHKDRGGMAKVTRGDVRRGSAQVVFRPISVAHGSVRFVNTFQDGAQSNTHELTFNRVS